MVKYWIIGRAFFQRFLDADKGGGAGGGGGAQSSGQPSGGAVESELDPKLFDSLPWDELDDATQETLKKIRAGAVATVQSNVKLKDDLQKTDRLARSFQSEADSLKAEKSKQAPVKPDDPYLTAVAEELQNAGYSAGDAQKLAPVFANMFKRVGVIHKEEIGKSIAPMATQVLASQAQNAFGVAQQNDPLGMFQVPEVAQAVWDLVKERVKAGAETTPDIVANLAKMAWADHQAKGLTTNGELPAAPPASAGMRTGGMTNFGPGGVRPIANPASDPNAPRTVLNDDTRQALATSFKNMLVGMDIAPTALKDAMKPKGKK